MPVRLATAVSVSGCRNCRCGSVIVRLHDASGATVSAILLPHAAAQIFVGQVEAAINPSRHGGLGAIRCEGTA